MIEDQIWRLLAVQPARPPLNRLEHIGDGAQALKNINILILDRHQCSRLVFEMTV